MANLTEIKPEIKYVVNENARKTDLEKASAEFMNREVVEKVRRFP